METLDYCPTMMWSLALVLAATTVISTGIQRSLGQGRDLLWVESGEHREFLLRIQL